jgi:hypothetical protein
MVVRNLLFDVSQRKKRTYAPASGDNEHTMVSFSGGGGGGGALGSPAGILVLLVVIAVVAAVWWVFNR